MIKRKSLKEIVDTSVFSGDFLQHLRRGYNKRGPTLLKSKFLIGWRVGNPTNKYDPEEEYLMLINEWWGFTERDITFAADLAKQGHSEQTITALLGYSKVYCDEAYDVITRLGTMVDSHGQIFERLVEELLMSQIGIISSEDPRLLFMCEPDTNPDEALREVFSYVVEKDHRFVALASPEIFAFLHKVDEDVLRYLVTWQRRQQYPDINILLPTLEVLTSSPKEFLQFFLGIQSDPTVEDLHIEVYPYAMSALQQVWPLTTRQQGMVKTVLTSPKWRTLLKQEHFSRVLTVIKNEGRTYTVEEMQELLDNSPPNILAFRRIGQGAFKRTYLAFDEVLEERVALKVFNPADEHQQPHLRRLLYADADYRHYTGPERRQRAMEREFKEEAQALRKVNHPNLAKFLGAGLQPYMYIIEEYIHGKTLLEIALNPKTRAKKRYTEQVCAHINQVALALNYLHDQFSLCHLDPKPSNIILPDLILGEMVPLHCRGVCVLTDLGSSQRVEPGEEIKLHKPISRIFQAPEIIERGMVAHGTDYWMLGITAYMVLFGHHPFYPSLTLEAWERLPVGSDEREELARKVEENVHVVMQSEDIYPKGMIYAPGQYPRIKHTLDAFPRDVGESARSFNPHLFSESVLVSSISDKNTGQEGLGSTPALFLYNLFVNILTQSNPFRYIIS